jgi:hypothetical protein
MACADPISQNNPVVHRSLSGVEVDWYFTVPVGCEGDFKVTAFRTTNSNPEDPRVVSAGTSGTMHFVGRAAQFVLNVLLTTTSPVKVILYTNGNVYAIIDVDPATVE